MGDGDPVALSLVYPRLPCRLLQERIAGTNCSFEGSNHSFDLPVLICGHMGSDARPFNLSYLKEMKIVHRVVQTNYPASVHVALGYIYAAIKTCYRSIFCRGKTCHWQVYPRQKMPTATFSQPYMCPYILYEQDLLVLKLCMTRMINLCNYFLIIMCMIRNFTILSPLFASVTAHLTIMTFIFTSWGTTWQSIDYMSAHTWSSMRRP